MSSPDSPRWYAQQIGQNGEVTGVDVSISDDTRRYINVVLQVCLQKDSSKLPYVLDQLKVKTGFTIRFR